MKQNFAQSILMITLSVLLFSCSAEVQSPQAVPQEQKPQGEDVGPFAIGFDATNTYQHSLKININQDEGFVEYKINAGQRLDLVLDENPVSVTGCDPQAVKRTSYWWPDETNKSVYKILTPATKFITGRKTTGILMHSFKNIGSCSSIEIKTKISKEFRPTRVGQICENFSSTEQCKILSYCKEQFVSGWFYELEVWNQQGTLWLKKYLNKTDGNRVLSSTYSVLFTDSINEAEYKSQDSDQYTLKINNLNYESVSTEKINGQTYKLNVSCDL
jgi:hypothetical protein